MRAALLVALAMGGLLVGVAEGQKKPAENAALLNARGVAFLKDGKVEEALEEFRRAAEADPKSVVIQSNLAYVYDRQGRIDDAVAAYKKVLEIEPANALARNNLGTLYSKQGLHDDAIREYEELVQRDPSNATARTNLENALRNKATVQERQDQIGAALKGADALPNDPRAAYNAARVYARLGDNDSAFTWLAKALELGYDQIDYLSLDPSLANLRKDPRFLKLLEERRR